MTEEQKREIAQLLDSSPIVEIAKQTLGLSRERLDEMYMEVNKQFTGDNSKITIEGTFERFLLPAETTEEKQFLSMMWAQYDAVQQLLMNLVPEPVEPEEIKTDLYVQPRDNSIN